MEISHAHGIDHAYITGTPHQEQGHLYITSAIDSRTSPHGAAIRRTQNLMRGNFPELYQPLPNEQSPRSHVLRKMLSANGYPDAENSFVMDHPHPELQQSQVVMAPDQYDDYHAGVALHPERNDYGTLAHEAGHILHHHAEGIDTMGVGVHEDELKHGPDFVHHYANALRTVHPEAADFLTDRYPKILNTVKKHGSLSTSAFTPTQRLFGPTQGLDHRLFDGEHLKPDVRKYILGTLSQFWEPLFGECGWEEWAKVYFAGSEASEWTSSTLEGNNDFDVLIGVAYDKFRSYQSRTSKYQSMTDEEITDDLNQIFKVLDKQTAAAMIPVEGELFGPFSNTWYVNPHSYDIRAIKPYAAYNVSDDEWAVKSPHLPSWSLKDFPEGKALLRECKAVAQYVKAILAMPEPYRTQQGAALWAYLHSDRSRAFGPQGEGWYDPGNVIEKWLDQEGLWERLVEIMVASRAHPEMLNAPVDWSNDPGKVKAQARNRWGH